MAYTIYQHLSYAAWANEKLVTRLSTLDDTLLNTELKSSFSSIAKTLLHMWNAELVWLNRLKGNSPVDWPLGTTVPGREKLLSGLVQSSKEFAVFVQNKGDSFVRSTIRYKTLKGDESENVVEELLYHLVNHGTYHRGQITTMLRELGITDPPSTDIIIYLRSLKK